MYISKYLKLARSLPLLYNETDIYHNKQLTENVGRGSLTASLLVSTVRVNFGGTGGGGGGGADDDDVES